MEGEIEVHSIELMVFQEITPALGRQPAQKPPPPWRFSPGKLLIPHKSNRRDRRDHGGFHFCPAIQS
jgi:hypothetical protein